jgi:hypothetical protein
MATNPKLPDFPENRPPRADDHGRLQLVPQSKFPWPILALIAGAALLIAIITVVPKGPHTAQPPSAAALPRQPTAEQILISHAKITPAPHGDAVYLTALLHNTGDSEITGAQVKAEFLSRKGEILRTETAPFQGIAQGGAASQDLTQAPIKPNESRPVRVYFEHTPKGWDHQSPQLTVTTVTGTTP